MMPEVWLLAKAFFIPKAGKPSHCTPKVYNPINFSSFLLKRLLSLHLHLTINPNDISCLHHAYNKGRSTEKALHKITMIAQKSLNKKEYAPISFLDIKGAFNNILPCSIIDALTEHRRRSMCLPNMADPGQQEYQGDS